MRLPSTPTSTSIPETNSSTSTFSSCSNASATAGRELPAVVCLRDPDRRAEPRRLDEDGIAERVLGAAAPSRSVMLRVTGIRWSRITALKRSLSMQSAEAAMPGADVRNVGHLEQPLQPRRPRRTARAGSAGRPRPRRGWPRPRPTCPERAAADAVARHGRRPALRAAARTGWPERPAAVAADLDRDHLVARRVEGVRSPSAPRRARSRARTSGRPSGRRRGGGSLAGRASRRRSASGVGRWRSAVARSSAGSVVVGGRAWSSAST